ncbi:MAG: hypothetical protein ACTSPG_03235 [Candidatus Hodarchaeales archaeon]
MFKKKKPSEVDILRKEHDTRIQNLEIQLEGLANRLSEFSKLLEGRDVDIQTQVTKEFRNALDEVRVDLEKISLELNNQILDLSTRVENIDQNASNWAFSINEQVEEFRKKYVGVLEELRQAKNIAVEKEEIMTKRYQELVEQLKEKERLVLEKESLSKERIDSLQTNVEKREHEVEDLRERIKELEEILKEKDKKIEELSQFKENFQSLKQENKNLQESNEMLKYELERAQTKIETMGEETKRSAGWTNAIKKFLSDSDSGRVLKQLMTLDESTVDELASMTGIATYTVQQIVYRLKDMGIISYDEGSRKVRLVE